MRGVRKLTRAAYANQRMTLSVKLRQSKKVKAEYDDRATWSNPCGVFSSFMFTQGRLAMPRIERGCLETRHFIFRTGSGVCNMSTAGEGNGIRDSAEKHTRKIRIDTEKSILRVGVIVFAALS